MHWPIEYSDELRPSTSHRTPNQIAEDTAGPIGGFTNYPPLHLTAQNEPEHQREELSEHPGSSGEGRFKFLRAYSPANTLVSAFRRYRK